MFVCSTGRSKAGQQPVTNWPPMLPSTLTELYCWWNFPPNTKMGVYQKTQQKGSNTVPGTRVASPTSSKALEKAHHYQPSPARCLLNRCYWPISKNLLETSVFPHALGAEVGVTASTVPVPRDGFGIEGHNDTKVFAHPVEDEACNPEVISHLNAFAWSHLELPLQGGGVTGSAMQRHSLQGTSLPQRSDCW